MIRRLITRFLARLLVDAGRETRRLGRAKGKSPEYLSTHARLRNEAPPRQTRRRRLML